MSIGLSIASGSLYEACRLRANRWTKADRTKMGWNNGANSNQLYRSEASRLLTGAPADKEAYISQEQNIIRDKPILYPIVNVNINYTLAKRLCFL